MDKISWERTSILVELRTFSNVSQFFIERDSVYLLFKRSVMKLILEWTKYVILT